MAVLALVRRQAVAERLARFFELGHRMALRTLDLRVGARQRPAGDRGVIEARDLERLGRMALVALEDRLGEPELPEVHVVMAARADARHAAVARAAPVLAVLRGRVMTALALRGRMHAGQRPDAVIDLRQAPSRRRVAMRAASLRHLLGELVAVRVRMAVGAGLLRDVPVDARSRVPVARRARRRRVLADERELRVVVQGGAEERGPEARGRVARLAFAFVPRRELSL